MIRSSFGQDLAWILATIILIEICIFILVRFAIPVKIIFVFMLSITKMIMIEILLRLGFILFEYFSCGGTKEVSLNYLANVLFFYFWFMFWVLFYICLFKACD